MAIIQHVRARAPTTIANLGYGFDVFAMAVDVAYDTVELSLGGTNGGRSAGLALSIAGPHAGDIPSDPLQNTAGRALQALRDAHGITDPLNVNIHKGTRSGSGMGSSAASAAAAVVAANALYRLNLSREQLVRFASEGERVAAGSPITDNVSGAIYGGFVVFSNEQPPQVWHVQPPASLRLVFALPAVHVRTEDARRVLPRELPLHESSRNVARAAVAALALAAGDIPAFGRAIEGSLFEQCRAKLIPGCAAVFEAARRAGALGVTISGAGPAIAAVAEEHSSLGGIAEAMRAAFARAGVESEAFTSAPAGGASMLYSGESTRPWRPNFVDKFRTNGPRHAADALTPAAVVAPLRNAGDGHPQPQPFAKATASPGHCSPA